MRLLIAIPFVTGEFHSEKCLESIVNSKAHILIIDNGADGKVKKVLNRFVGRDNVSMISNDKNIYVNPAWNQALDYFENSGFSHLAIMNSDLVMRDGWYDVLEAATGMGDDISFFPELVGKGTPTEKWDGERITLEPIDKHISGVFIFMSRRLAKFLGRFPEDVKIWFGDTYFYDLINRTMFMSAMVKELKAFHFGSRTIKRVKDIHELIDKDKVVWEEKVKPELEKRIESFVKI